MLPHEIADGSRGPIIRPLGRTSRLLDEARPGPRGADGVVAYRHDRRVAPAVLLRFVHQRRSLHRKSLDASGIALRGTVSRLVPDSQLLDCFAQRLVAGNGPIPGETTKQIL